MAGEKAEELMPLVPIVAAPGGLLAPWIGLRTHGTGKRLIPHLGLNFGPGFTGDLVRPLLQATVGADIKVGAGASVGPVVGFSQLFQRDSPGASTDARCQRTERGDVRARLFGVDLDLRTDARVLAPATIMLSTV
jgi:hypothetical protein